jgi:uncharacterized protein YbgA (DUF1722 family)/uncharacterized protein YbbK (DUF523 family)
MEKILVGISGCLLGEPVRYDGGHKLNSYIERTLGAYFEFRRFCPEVACGLGVPRPALRLLATAEGVRCVGVQDRDRDVTADLEDVSAAQHQWLAELSAYILKKDSPSCGMQRVKVYHDELPVRSGSGVFAAYLQKTFPNLPVEEEGRLGDPLLRENFIRRVFVMRRWRQLSEQGFSIHDLMSFHSRHKLVAMSHNQNTAHALGRIIANITPDTLETDAAVYISVLMSCLKIIATRGNHVNVLQHIQGYLKTALDKDDKQELTETIEDYRQNRLPLIVPLTLLRHHFRKQPNDFITASYYMQPHPGELALLNEI